MSAALDGDTASGGTRGAGAKAAGAELNDDAFIAMAAGPSSALWRPTDEEQRTRGDSTNSGQSSLNLQQPLRLAVGAGAYDDDDDDEHAAGICISQGPTATATPRFSATLRGHSLANTMRASASTVVIDFPGSMPEAEATRLVATLRELSQLVDFYRGRSEHYREQAEVALGEATMERESRIALQRELEWAMSLLDPEEARQFAALAAELDMDIMATSPQRVNGFDRDRPDLTSAAPAAPYDDDHAHDSDHGERELDFDDDDHVHGEQPEESRAHRPVMRDSAGQAEAADQAADYDDAYDDYDYGDEDLLDDDDEFDAGRMCDDVVAALYGDSNVAKAPAPSAKPAPQQAVAAAAPPASVAPAVAPLALHRVTDAGASPMPTKPDLAAPRTRVTEAVLDKVLLAAPVTVVTEQQPEPLTNDSLVIPAVAPVASADRADAMTATEKVDSTALVVAPSTAFVAVQAAVQTRDAATMTVDAPPPPSRMRVLLCWAIGVVRAALRLLMLWGWMFAAQLGAERWLSEKLEALRNAAAWASCLWGTAMLSLMC